VNCRKFRSRNVFRSFKDEVLRERRYFWSEAAEEFLKTVALASRRRIKSIPTGSMFWRAQLGHRTDHDKNSGAKVIKPHPEERMRPLSDQAIEGRVNPKGIPCLYFATSPEVAMTEVRPWIGSTISLAAFETTRDLKLVDCTEPPSENPKDPTESAVWAEINEAFAEPIVRSDTTGDYAATQILAEVFKGEGADGVVYKSAFLESGLNLALFDLECAKLLDTTLFKVENASFEFAPLDPKSTDDPPPAEGYARPGQEKRKGSPEGVAQ
jgi:RES domain-containing protein